MRSIRVKGIVACLSAALLCGCASAPAQFTETAPASQVEWSAALLQAGQEASAGRYAVADRVLADFTMRYPASGEAVESMYWRALYKLDPANTGSTPHDAIALLDNYLSSGTVPRRAEALTLRRVATTLETRAATPVATAASKPELVKVDDKAKDEELARVKDELAKANAELERIRRRLAQPKP